MAFFGGKKHLFVGQFIFVSAVLLQDLDAMDRDADMHSEDDASSTISSSLSCSGVGVPKDFLNIIAQVKSEPWYLLFFGSKFEGCFVFYLS